MLLAAGKGSRAGSQKQYEMIAGYPIFWYSLKTFMESGMASRVVLVAEKKDHKKLKNLLTIWGWDEVVLVEGGETRAESVARGAAAAPASEWLIIHNAANPFVTKEEIKEVLAAAQQSGAACVAHPAVDTLKKVEHGLIVETIDRNTVWQAQTPQVLRANLLKEAEQKNLASTDDVHLAEMLGVIPTIVSASQHNQKITTRKDLEWARFLIEGSQSVHGIGMDSHRFEEEKKGLALGGLTLENEPAMVANSDGDVMLHALGNAILQVLGEKSLSSVADQMREEGITSSTAYIEEILQLMRSKKMALTQVGFQLEGARPKIDPIADELKENLSKILALPIEKIGITATTGEDLTAFGRGEGLQCFASVTMLRHVDR